MKYNQLGRSPLLISEIGFGCMSLGADEKANTTLLHQAMDTGINFFDSADLYEKGMNETMLGKAFKQSRDKVVIATKVGNQWRTDGSGWDWNPGKAYIIAAVEKSLQRLQTDYIDLYQLHGGTMNDPIDDTIEAFEILQQQGKIRCYGISSIRPAVIRTYVERAALASVMMQYSVLDRRPEETCLPLLEQNHIGVLARGSIAKGLLVNKPAADYPGHTTAAVQTAADTIKNISGPQRSPTATALRFVLQQSAITCAVVGIRTAEQLQYALQTITSPLLTTAEMALLQNAVTTNYYQEHR